MEFKIDIELKKTLEILKNGGVILYPTDTIWGIGCDATNSNSIEKIFKIKERSESKSLIILVDNISRISTHVDYVPQIALDLIEKEEKPLTIIFSNAKNLPNCLISKDGSIAIRVVRDVFCKKLIQLLDKPIVSTSANISGENSPINYNDIDSRIRNQVDYIVDLKKENIEIKAPSKIIKIVKEDNILIIRD